VSLDARDPANRRPITREHLEELAVYLGVEFSGSTQRDMALDAATDAVLVAFFD
jgi:hypothetical protein